MVAVVVVRNRRRVWARGWSWRWRVDWGRWGRGRERVFGRVGSVGVGDSAVGDISGVGGGERGRLVDGCWRGGWVGWKGESVTILAERFGEL